MSSASTRCLQAVKGEKVAPTSTPAPRSSPRTTRATSSAPPCPAAGGPPTRGAGPSSRGPHHCRLTGTTCRSTTLRASPHSTTPARPRSTGLDVLDVRFPTSRDRDGSDAMNPVPDYSAAYVRLEHRAPASRDTRLLFTTGRGNEVACAAVAALAPLVVGLDVDELLADIGVLLAAAAWDGQLRWLGPEKGVVHMAVGGGRQRRVGPQAAAAGKPLWQVLADSTPGGDRRRSSTSATSTTPSRATRRSAILRAAGTDAPSARRAARARAIPPTPRRRLARLRRREARAPRPRGRRRRLPP